jgi:thioredoxin:protein disulfide reductase
MTGMNPIRAQRLCQYFSKVTGATLFAVSAFATSLSAQTPPPAPLPVDDAFIATATVRDGQVLLKFDVLSGHYLFRDRFEFQRGSDKPVTVDAFKQDAGAVGKTKDDPSFGRVKVFDRPVSLIAAKDIPSAGKTQLTVIFQGCSEVAGVCYPPTKRTFTLASNSRDVAPNELAKPGLSSMFKKQVSGQ